MEESVTYQAILERGAERGKQQGALAEAQKLLLLAGQPKFGPPGPSVRAAVSAITDLARLESLISRVHAATSWDDLLASN